jgi:Fur family peroxide stress response transcriptional regulator
MDTEQRLNDLLARLRERGNRLTPQRVAILRAVVMHRGHPTVEQLHREILADFPTTSLATVYKTMSLLKEAGEVLELGFGDYGSRYDGRKPYPHPHLICTCCGAILDSELAGFEDLVAGLAQQAGFQVENHRFDIFGLCRACRKRS